jgi:hypothetical protein
MVDSTARYDRCGATVKPLAWSLQMRSQQDGRPARFGVRVAVEDENLEA